MIKVVFIFIILFFQNENQRKVGKLWFEYDLPLPQQEISILEM